MDPFRNYDQWLTTDRMAEDAERAADQLAELWCEAVDAYDLPVDADDPEHPEHGIYAAWKRFVELVDERRQRLEAEVEAALYEQEVAWQAQAQAEGWFDR